MNPQKDSNIDWAKMSWNPGTGCNNPPEVCPVKKDCWAKKNSKRQRDFTFLPTFYPKRLDQPLHRRTPTRIFALSKADAFCPGFKNAWRSQIIDKIALARWHKFIMLTKNTANLYAYAKRMSEGAKGIIVFPPNLWIGPSITGLEPSIIRKLVEVPGPEFGGERLISFEPLLADIPLEMRIPTYYKQYFIGALSLGNKKTIQPKPEWVLHVIEHAKRDGAAVMMKKNLEDNDAFTRLKQIHPDLRMPGEKP